MSMDICGYPWVSMDVRGYLEYIKLLVFQVFVETRMRSFGFCNVRFVFPKGPMCNNHLFYTYFNCFGTHQRIHWNPPDPADPLGTRGAWNQVPGTKHLVPGTWCLVSGTRYLVLGTATRYQVPGDKYLVFGNWYQVRGTDTWYKVSGTGYLVPSTRHLVRGTKCLVPGNKNLVPGTCYMVPGTQVAVTK